MSETIMSKEGYRSGWYREIGDEGIGVLVEGALARRKNLDAARERLKQARLLTELQMAENAPRLGIGIESGRQWERSFGGEQVNETVSRFTADLNWELDWSGRLESLVEARIAHEGIVELELEMLRSEVAGEVVRVWVSIAAVSERLSVLDLLLQEAKLQNMLIENAFEKGNATFLDLLEQRTYLAQLDRELIAEQGNLEVNRRRLIALCGEDLCDEVLSGKQVLAVPQEREIRVTTEGLLDSRAELLVVFYELVAREAELGEAVSRNWPRLEIGLDFLSDASSIADLFESQLTTLFASLAWDLWEADAKRLRVEYGKSRVEELLDLLEAYAIDAVAEAEGAALREHYARLGYEAGLVNVMVADERFEEAERRFINGSEGYDRMLVASRGRLEARLALTEAKKDAVLARLEMMLAVGWREELREEEE